MKFYSFFFAFVCPLFSLTHATSSQAHSHGADLDQYQVVTFLKLESSPDEPVAISKHDVLEVLNNTSGCITIKGAVYRICKGLPAHGVSSHTVTIYAGGYSNAGKPYTYCIYNAIKSGLIKDSAVVFNYPADTSFKTFNFCQKPDIDSLRHVYSHVVNAFPHSSIILMGACKGGTTLLRFLAEHGQTDSDMLTKVIAAIVESPVITPYHALKNQWFGRLCHWLMTFTFPAYNHKALKTVFDATSFASHIPVLIGSLPGDTVSELPDIISLSQHLRSLGVMVEHCIAPEEDAHIIHGQIGKSRVWQKAVAAFITRFEPIRIRRMSYL